jgi:hypothetical protein
MFIYLQNVFKNNNQTLSQKRGITMINQNRTFIMSNYKIVFMIAILVIAAIFIANQLPPIQISGLGVQQVYGQNTVSTHSRTGVGATLDYEQGYQGELPIGNTQTTTNQDFLGRIKAAFLGGVSGSLDYEQGYKPLTASASAYSFILTSRKGVSGSLDYEPGHDPDFLEGLKAKSRTGVSGPLDYED